MKTDYLSMIESCLDEKIEFLNKYKDITDSILNAEFETLSELIAQRQLIIKEVDKRTAKIKKAVLEQDAADGRVLEGILSFKSVEGGEKFSEISSKAHMLEKVLVEISEKEKAAKQKMDEMRLLLSEQMTKSNKSKQVIDYCNSFATVNKSGSNLNSKM